VLCLRRGTAIATTENLPVIQQTVGQVDGRRLDAVTQPQQGFLGGFRVKCELTDDAILKIHDVGLG
jgi:hypothetical protein